MGVTVYGIPNCDTVKKARAWLEREGVEYVFHDYKKAGADRAQLRRWIGQSGWETVLNRRGTTFRKLPEAETAGMDEDKAIEIMVAHPSTIKRPVVEYPGGILVGFDEAQWRAALA